jgi:hypothetical protein
MDISIAGEHMICALGLCLLYVYMNVMFYHYNFVFDKSTDSQTGGRFS